MAIGCFDEVLKIDPRNLEAWYGKGVALSELGRFTEAIECYDKALQIDPKLKQAIGSKKQAEEELSER